MFLMVPKLLHNLIVVVAIYIYSVCIFGVLTVG